MKNLSISSLWFFTLLFAAVGFTACDKSEEEILPDEVTALTTEEKTNLVLMREEEKFARDVYLHMHEKYDLRIFSNIAASEQVHMDAVLELIEKYGLEDPASAERGVFLDLALQQLYDDLVAQGEISLVEALKVGATIEDLDIRDLDNAILGTSKTNLINLYEMLSSRLLHASTLFYGTNPIIHA